MIGSEGGRCAPLSHPGGRSAGDFSARSWMDAKAASTDAESELLSTARRNVPTESYT